MVKTYLALVHGTLRGEQRIERAISSTPGRPQRVRLADHANASVKGARRAASEVEALEQLGDLTLVRVRIRQGLRHQIRAHLASIGHAIVGDQEYADRSAPLPLSRHFLHAGRIELTDPDTNEPRVLESPLPNELHAYVEALRAGRR